MGAAEACCERAGSLLQNNWTKQKGEDAGAVMDSVLLQEARVTGIGNPRDEMICQEIAAALLTLGRNPYLTGRRRSAPGESTSAVLARVRAAQQALLTDSGRGSHGDPVRLLADGESPEEGIPEANAVLCRGRISRHLPTEKAKRRRLAMPDLVVSAEVQRAMRSATSDRGVSALPMFLEDPRRAARHAGSVRRERLSKWLASAEGKQWRAEKEERYRGAD